MTVNVGCGLLRCLWHLAMTGEAGMDCRDAHARLEMTVKIRGQLNHGYAGEEVCPPPPCIRGIDAGAKAPCVRLA